jgi:dihydropteroate synthase
VGPEGCLHGCEDDEVTPLEPASLDLPRTPALVLRGQSFDASRPAVMAIINRTSDSFFSGNRHADLDSAKRALDAAVEAGADIVDVGGVRAGQEGEVVTAE